MYFIITFLQNEMAKVFAIIKMNITILYKISKSKQANKNRREHKHMTSTDYGQYLGAVQILRNGGGGLVFVTFCYDYLEGGGGGGVCNEGT